MSITRSKPFYLVAGVTDAAVSTLREVPTKVSSVRIERRDIEKAVATLQLEAIGLPARVQATAVGLAEGVTGRVDDVYGDLVTRGRTVVGRIRRQQATQELTREATTAVRRTKATATTTKKSATATRRTAKGASTAARKTTKAAARATKAGAGKVGK